ncbi:ATP-grasp domain-containing protein [Tenacibaculum xiamenense]|uniref:D-alanine--D-alanine ligase n=1 Tax=Tenacibaculum xiamenense TaxID=1261553 RepID=UPI003893E9C5
MKYSKKYHKIFNWEYWPSSFFYIPNLPYAFYLAWRAKKLTFFTAANPSIKSSGNGTESKYETIQLIPEDLRPKSLLVKPNTSFNSVLEDLNRNKIIFPLIAKPDIGFRGLLVKKIKSESELKNYLEKYKIDIIIQEYVDLNNECGIFYVRNPKAEKGKITSITLKKFLSVKGDGVTKLKDLVLNDDRAKLYFDIICQTKFSELEKIPAKNESIKLSVIGNHCKGTQFINGNYLISQKLHDTFDKINKSINGWYYGRLDIKYNSFEELERGENIKILEINGIIAEPTHIYDSENFTYLEALKEIRNHWKNLYNISTTNHKALKIPYKNTREFSKEILQLKNYISTIKNII